MARLGDARRDSAYLTSHITQTRELIWFLGRWSHRPRVIFSARSAHGYLTLMYTESETIGDVLEGKGAETRNTMKTTHQAISGVSCTFMSRDAFVL